MKSRNSGYSFDMRNKHRMFSSSSRQNQISSKGRRADCLIKDKEMSLNVLDRIDKINEDESNPFLSQKVLGTARIAMEVLSKPGKKIMAEIIEKIGPVEEYNGTDVSRSLGRLVKFFDSHITDCYITVQKLKFEEYKDFYDMIEKAQQAHYTFVTVHKSSLQKRRINPKIAILKIYVLEHIYSMKYLKAIMDVVLDRLDSATESELPKIQQLPKPTSNNYQRIPSPEALMNQKARLKTEKQRGQHIPSPVQRIDQQSLLIAEQQSARRIPSPEALMNQKARLRTEKQRRQ